MRKWVLKHIAENAIVITDGELEYRPLKRMNRRHYFVCHTDSERDKFRMSLNLEWQRQTEQPGNDRDCRQRISKLRNSLREVGGGSIETRQTIRRIGCESPMG